VRQASSVRRIAAALVLSGSSALPAAADDFRLNVSAEILSSCSLQIGSRMFNDPLLGSTTPVISRCNTPALVRVASTALAIATALPASTNTTATAGRTQVDTLVAVDARQQVVQIIRYTIEY
jgi:hypothetical protein